MLENYEENPGTGKTGIQEPVSLLSQTREHVLLDINICSFNYLEYTTYVHLFFL